MKKQYYLLSDDSQSDFEDRLEKLVNVEKFKIIGQLNVVQYYDSDENFYFKYSILLERSIKK